MKAGWEVKELQTVSAINYGYTESASSEPVGPRFLRITDIQDDQVDWDSVPYCKIEPADIAKYRLTSGDIVFARTGATTGKSFLVKDPPDAVFASYLIRLRLHNNKLLPEFLSRFFQTPDYWESIKAGSSGSTLGGFNATKLGALSIPIPPLPEQQRIVRTLDEAFEGIAIATANAEKNLRNARVLFESHLEAVFRRRGEGWVDAKLGDICHKITDGTHVTPTYIKEGVPFLSVKNLTQGFIDFSNTRFISAEEHAFLTKSNKPMRDDILYTKVGTTGIAKVVDVDDEFSIFVSVALLKPKHEVVFNLFLEHFLNAPYAREQARKRTRGMANKNLVITDIKEIEVHFPKALGEQRTIVAKLDSLRAETQRLEAIYRRKLAALDELKKSLLHRAFNGQLTMDKGQWIRDKGNG